MILGKIIGKITTKEFKFIVEKETKKFEYVQVYHKAYEYVLCQVVELETDSDKTLADCQVIGYKENDRIKKPMIPFDPQSEVLRAEDDFIKEVVKLNNDYKGFIGRLDGRDIPVSMDLNKVLSMHLAVLAKSGSGKSYAVGVLLEEMISKNIPLLIIDPHGEYSSLKYKNSDEKDITELKKYGLEPEGFNVVEYGDIEINKGVHPLKLNLGSNQEELIHMLPGKLSTNQLALVYNSLKTSDPNDLNSLILSLEQEEHNAKYSVINMVEYLRDLEIFSNTNTNYAGFIKQGQATIMNLKGINPEVQEMIVYKITKELFELRKKEKVPPFFLVIEEAHNYCPERSFGETKASKILRNIASEGRKFGLGLCLISQRPARVDKSVLSQCSSQIILKVTNPNDLKALSNSVEGLTSNTEKEIQNLNIGQGLVTGITDIPLLVNIRPRKSLHGGVSKKIVEADNFSDRLEDYKEKEVLPLIIPTMSAKDVKLMSEEDVKEVKVVLRPCYLCKVESKNNNTFSLLIDRTNSGIIVDKESGKIKKLPEMEKLSKEQVMVLKQVFKHKELDKNKLEEKAYEALLRSNYLVKEKNYLKISEDYAFSKLDNYKTFESVKYEDIEYHEKQSALDDDKVINKLGKYVKIKDKKECYLVTYKPEY